MLGGSNSPGIMALTLNELYNQIHHNNMFDELTIKISYMEVYNESLRDLLVSNSELIDIREDPEKGITLVGNTEVICTTTQEVMELLR